MMSCADCGKDFDHAPTCAWIISERVQDYLRTALMHRRRRNFDGAFFNLGYACALLQLTTPTNDPAWRTYKRIRLMIHRSADAIRGVL